MAKYKKVTTIIFDLGGVIIDLDWNLCIRNFENLGISNMRNLVSTTLQRGFVLHPKNQTLADISCKCFWFFGCSNKPVWREVDCKTDREQKMYYL